MAESMKNAWKGQGGGLQETASKVGDMMAENVQSQGQVKSNRANESLSEMSKGSEKSAPTVGGTSIDAAKQSANQETGTADHLGMGGN